MTCWGREKDLEAEDQASLDQVSFDQALLDHAPPKDDAITADELGSFRLRMRLENVHISLWLLKDFAWIGGLRVMGWTFGVAAVAWSVLLVVLAIKDRDWAEAHMNVATSLWLAANFVWMASELGMFHWRNNFLSKWIFVGALAWQGLYYLLRPTTMLLKTSRVAKKHYGGHILGVHFREYEYLHALFWIGKDLSWNRKFKATWVGCFVLTFLIGAHFVYLSRRQPRECAHYVAQLIWVLANFVWAFGELCEPSISNAPTPLFHLGLNSPRWWAQVLLLVALLPTALSHCPCCCSDDDDDEDDPPMTITAPLRQHPDVDSISTTREEKDPAAAAAAYAPPPAPPRTFASE